MREAYRLQKHELHDFLKANEKSMSLFFLYQAKELPHYDEVYEKIGTILKRLIKLSNEKTPGNS